MENRQAVGADAADRVGTYCKPRSVGTPMIQCLRYSTGDSRRRLAGGHSSTALYPPRALKPRIITR